MKTMMTAGKWAVIITAGGLALGALLGDAADPTIKGPVPQWWQLTGHHEIVPSSDHAFSDTWPEDLSPLTGYRPDLDYDAEAWDLPIRANELTALADEPAADALPSVTYGVADSATNAAADEAEAAAEDALSAEAEAEAPPVQVRRAELAAGIY